MAHNQNSAVLNLEEFVAQKGKANSDLRNLINYLVRATNRHKFDYNQLKYIFRSVRDRCDVRPVKAPQRLYELPTDEQLTQFYRGITDPIHALIFEVLEGTGLRVSELCRLKVEQISFDENLIFVQQGKGGKDRQTVMSNELRDKLKIYLAGRNNKYLFESNRHTCFTPRRIQQMCKRYKEASGVSCDLTCHTFRHLWNTRLAMANVPREKREILAGHSSGSKVQDTYTHLAVGGIKDEVVEILGRTGRKK